ncbi:MAG: methyltransferase, partial [Phycisphaerae bacterium]|nr:methyltransferase [Phycisphaerae bacterium]
SLLEQAASVRDALWRMRRAGKTIAFWGATGKGASFLNAFDLSGEDWPTVVDSDYKKVGRYVPRTAQLIRPPQYLQENPADVIIITTQWRAKDIAREIKQRGIQCGQIMILADHRLKPFNGEVA